MSEQRMADEQVDWGVFLRKIGKQRARKLRRRGVQVWWSVPLQSLVWVRWKGGEVL